MIDRVKEAVVLVAGPERGAEAVRALQSASHGPGAEHEGRVVWFVRRRIHHRRATPDERDGVELRFEVPSDPEALALARVAFATAFMILPCDRPSPPDDAESLVILRSICDVLGRTRDRASPVNVVVEFCRRASFHWITAVDGRTVAPTVEDISNRLDRVGARLSHLFGDEIGARVVAQAARNDGAGLAATYGSLLSHSERHGEIYPKRVQLEPGWKTFEDVLRAHLGNAPVTGDPFIPVAMAVDGRFSTNPTAEVTGRAIDCLVIGRRRYVTDDSSVSAEASVERVEAERRPGVRSRPRRYRPPDRWME